MRTRLDALLEETVANGRLTRYVWLRKFEVGKNAADVNRLLDRMEFLKDLGLSPDILDGVPPHRIARLRRQGERYFADEVRDISSDRRLAILAVCVVEWRAAVADAVVETHDRIVGQTWRKAERLNKFQMKQHVRMCRPHWWHFKIWDPPCLRRRKTMWPWTRR